MSHFEIIIIIMNPFIFLHVIFCKPACGVAKGLPGLRDSATEPVNSDKKLDFLYVLPEN